MAKLLFFDVETTGLDATKHGIWQIAGRIEIDGKIVEDFDFYMNPGDVEISPEALELNNLTVEDLEEFDTQESVFKMFLEMLGDHVNKFDSKDKLQLIAYNARFDDLFLRKWFDRNKDKYFGSWFYQNFIDIHTLVGYVLLDVRQDVESFKLSKIVEVFNIKLENAHDAMYDVIAMYELWQTLKNDHLVVKL